MGPVSATDVDDGDTLTLAYTLGGTDVASFTIVPGSGQLQTSAALNYENKGIYQVTVTVTDDDTANPLSDTITVTIRVTDVNDVPVFPDDDEDTANTKMASREIAENTAAGMNIGDPVAATDEDRDTLTYTLSNVPDSTDAALFAIDRGTGQLQTKAALNAEPTSEATHMVAVHVSDGNGGTDSITVTITVTDVNDAPIFADGTAANRSVAENTLAGQDIGALLVVTDDDGDAVAYTLGGVLMPRLLTLWQPLLVVLAHSCKPRRH